MSFEIDLTNRRALVTGAGQHIGRAIARALAAAGAHVGINDIVGDRAKQVVGEIEQSGGAAEACVFDLTDPAAVSREIRSFAPEILINNAAGTGAGNPPGGVHMELARFADSDPAQWGKEFSLSLFGVLHCTHAALPAMLEGGWGRVITIISDAARVGEPRMALYAAAKAGAAGFCRSLASEVGRSGITVNCVSLGMIESEHAKGEEYLERLPRLLRPYKLDRLGRPTDPAALVTFLASEHAGWITGQTYPVNGGYSSTL
jgi:3-oxoacyl-[acyl-carrier protein] reductase